jgi:outer membrane protein OmpA-like peptidoglycan-associated protein
MAFLLPVAADHSAVSQALQNVPTVQPDFRITGFSEYEDRFGTLPQEQQDVIDKLAKRIVDSQSEFTPIVAFIITGHADKDLRANNPFRKPGETRKEFEMRISKARASRARDALLRKIRALSWGNPSHILAQILNEPKRSRIVGMGASDLLVENPQSESDRKLNRRVEIYLVTALVPDPDPDPDPKPTPDPTNELPKRLSHGLEVLGRREMPSGPVQTARLKCMFTKLKDNANVNDLFIDSHEGQPVTINGKQMDGLQNVTLSYGNVTQEEFEQFFGHAKANVLAGPGFDAAASDEDVLRAMDGLDRLMLKAIGYLDSHMQRFNNPTLGLFAADPTKRRLNNLIHDLQDNQNSIYSCK